MGMHTTRQNRMSNFELLRIVAMLLVMFGHSHMRIYPFPTEATISQHSVVSFVEIMTGCFSTMGVGIFVAISGWFGIRFKVEGLLKYVFQVLFVLWSIYGVAILFDITELNTTGLKISMGFYEGYWFVISYLGLYLLSPVLNSFIENTSKRTFQTVLLSLMLFQCYFSWLTAWYDYYNGYSIVLFSIIYLTAAYFRKYPMAWIERYAPWLLAAVISTMAVIATTSLWQFGHAARQIRDDNPLVILATILLLLCFKKLRFQSKTINWLAASCFSVYLIHFNPFVYPYLMSAIRNVYSQYDGIAYGIMFLLLLLATYIACTVIDQVRIFTWNGLNFLKDYNKKLC